MNSLNSLLLQLFHPPFAQSTHIKSILELPFKLLKEVRVVYIRVFVRCRETLCEPRCHGGDLAIDRRRNRS